jgi:hypothetical protein
MQSLDGTTSICPAGVFKVPAVQNVLNSVISFDGPPQEHSAFSSAGLSGEHPQEGAASFFSPQQQDCFCLDIVFLLYWFSTHAKPLRRAAACCRSPWHLKRILTLFKARVREAASSLSTKFNYLRFNHPCVYAPQSPPPNTGII